MSLYLSRLLGIRRGNDFGFSMIETVIVFLIIGIVVAFALPMVSGAVKAYNLRSASNHLAERISAVRALAIAKNRSVTFSFNNVSGRYGFDFDLPEGDGIPDTFDPAEPDTKTGGYYWEILPNSVQAEFPGGTPIKITFNSRGELPIGAAAKTITLQSYGKTAQVVVNLRGKITVQ
jgi:type II secretory pathway pseudopilin PulG